MCTARIFSFIDRRYQHFNMGRRDQAVGVCQAHDRNVSEPDSNN